MHDLQIAPSRHVWNDIADALSVPKKRRVAAWWSFAAGSVILTAGLWIAADKLFFHNKNNLVDNNKTTLSNSVIGNLNLSTPSSPADHSDGDVVTKNDYFKETNKGTINSGDLKFDQKEIAAGNGYKPFSSMLLPSLDKNDAYTFETLQSQPVITLGSPVNNDQKPILNNKSQLSNDNEQSSVTKKIAGMPALQNNSSSPVAGTAAIKNKSAKKSLWSFFFDGGSTNTTNRNAFFKKSNPLIYHNGTESDTVKSMKPAYPGFHAGVGIQYSLALSKHWSFYTGLQLSFLLNHQRTGTEVRQESEISNATDTLSADQKYVQIPYHYVDGVSTDLTNYATWLEVPVGFGYKIIPRGKVKVELRGGASVAHMSTDKWLIPDGRYDRFYYCNPLTNNYIVNLHEDIVVTLPNHKIIGLQYQHSLSGLAKKEVEPALYWSNISLYTTIPLK